MWTCLLPGLAWIPGPFPCLVSSRVITLTDAGRAHGLVLPRFLVRTGNRLSSRCFLTLTSCLCPSFVFISSIWEAQWQSPRCH